MHIHIIEDNADDAILVERNLRNHFHKKKSFLELNVVHDNTLAAGLATVARFAESTTPFIFTYLDLRNDGGNELQTIAAIPLFKEPVYVISSFSEDADLGQWGYGVKTACLAAGARAFLCKSDKNFYHKLVDLFLEDAERAFAREVVTAKKATQPLSLPPRET